MMNRRELIKVGFASALVVPGGGCATLFDMFQKYLPTISMKKFNITGMTLQSIATKFTIEINNPNPIGFVLDGLDYGLHVAGNELASGKAPRGITLKPKQGVLSDLDLDFQLGNTGAAILDLIGKNIVPFELNVVGHFFKKEAGGDGLELPLDYKSQLPMPKVPALNVRSLNPTSVSPEKVGFRLETAVHNNNGFEIPVDALAMNLKLDGRQVLTNHVAKGLRVPANQTSNLPVDFGVALEQLGLSLAEIAAGRRMNWELASEMRSGKLAIPFKHSGSMRFG
jgi:LEA14-like dessication related protein